MYEAMKWFAEMLRCPDDHACSAMYGHDCHAHIIQAVKHMVSNSRYLP